MQKKRFWQVVLSAVVLLAGCGVWAKDLFECEFKPGRWNKADFIEVQMPVLQPQEIWERSGRFEQYMNDWHDWHLNKQH